MTDIEIVFDPLEEALANHLHMGERHQVLPDGEWIRAARRHTGRDSLFVYFHRETCKYVLADWVWPPDTYTARVCIELEVMDLPPDQNGADRPSMEWLTTRCCHADEMHKRMKAKLVEARGLKQGLAAESQEQKAEAIKYLKKKGMDASARTLEQSSYVGETEGGERLQHAVSELQNMTGSRKIYS